MSNPTLRKYRRLTTEANQLKVRDLPRINITRITTKKTLTVNSKISGNPAALSYYFPSH